MSKHSPAEAMGQQGILLLLNQSSRGSRLQAFLCKSKICVLARWERKGRKTTYYPMTVCFLSCALKYVRQGGKGRQEEVIQ